MVFYCFSSGVAPCVAYDNDYILLAVKALPSVDQQKWRRKTMETLSALRVLLKGVPWSPLDSLHQGSVMAMQSMCSLSLAWTNRWVAGCWGCEAHRWHCYTQLKRGIGLILDGAMDHQTHTQNKKILKCVWCISQCILSWISSHYNMIVICNVLPDFDRSIHAFDGFVPATIPITGTFTLYKMFCFVYIYI